MLPRLLRLTASLAIAVCLCAALVFALGLPGTAQAAPAAVRNYPGAAPCNTTLQGCINASADGDEIVIAAGTYITSIDLNRNLRLRGVSSATTILQALPSRKVITASAAFTAGFQMEILSLTLKGGNSPFGGSGAALMGGAIHHRGAAPLLIANVLITGNSTVTPVIFGGGLFINFGAGPATVLNSAFFNNLATDGGAIDANAPLTIVNGYFERNRCILVNTCFGGAIRVGPAGSVLISDSAVFTRNTADGSGGAIGAFGPLRIYGRASSAIRFERNSSPVQVTGAAGHGGAIYAEGNLTLTGATFVSNTAIGSGGAVLVSGTARAVLGGDLIVESLSFSSNSANDAGGAMAVLGHATANVVHLFPTANAAGRGGGMYIGPSAVVSVGISNFTANTAAAGNGGGVLNEGTLTLIPNALFAFPLAFVGNHAALNGGGVATTGTLTIIGALAGQRVLLQANTADNHGGGLFALNSAHLESLLVVSNTSFFGGGGGLALDARGVITNIVLERNTASVSSGGGALIAANSDITIGNTVISGNAAGSFGGGIINFGALTFLRSEATGYPVLLTKNSVGNGPGGGIANFGFLTDRRLGAGRIGLIGNTSGGPGGGLYDSGLGVSLEGWDVISNTANGIGLDDGGGFYLSGGGVVSDTLFQQNTSAGSGGGIYGAGFEMVNSRVLSNTAGGTGGGVNNAGFGVITGTLIQNNQSGGNGGGVFSGAFLNMADSQVISNAATTGGGLYLQGDNTTSRIVNSHVERNRANVGGGLFNNAPTVVTATDFISNLGVGGGGGIASTNQLTLAGGTLAFNRTANCSFVGRGGALLLSNFAVVRDAAVTGNAACDGGGAFVAGHMQVLGGLWSDNNAINLGGAVYYTSPNGITTDTLGITATQFISNRALNGGGLFLRGNDARLVNTLLARNSATGGAVGAAITAFGGNTRILHATITGRALNPKDAINANGAVNISNTIITSHTTGIRRAAGTAIEDYNRFFGNTTNVLGLASGTHSASADQHFANPAIDDYRLTAASGTAINAGFNFGVAVDFEGVPRSFGGAPDIGYDEYALQVYLPLIRR